jgi:hypothetical protein
MADSNKIVTCSGAGLSGEPSKCVTQQELDSLVSAADFMFGQNKTLVALNPGYSSLNLEAEKDNVAYDSVNVDPGTSFKYQEPNVESFNVYTGSYSDSEFENNSLLLYGSGDTWECDIHQNSRALGDSTVNNISVLSIGSFEIRSIGLGSFLNNNILVMNLSDNSKAVRIGDVTDGSQYDIMVSPCKISSFPNKNYQFRSGDRILGNGIFHVQILTPSTYRILCKDSEGEHSEFIYNDSKIYTTANRVGGLLLVILN